MQTKKIPHMIIYILSLLVLGYILYVSVYNQIISQSDGFFNMIIFAGILLLVFILLSLIIKLMAYTPTSEISPIIKYAIIAGALCLLVLSVFLRINYSSSIPAEESVYYNACEYISEGSLSEAYDISEDLLYNPGHFPYAFFSSFIYKVLDLESDVIIYINVFYLSVCAIFMFLLVSLISDKVCAFLSFILVLFMPGNSFAVYSYNYDLFFAAHFLIVSYLMSVLIYKHFNNIIKPILLSILTGILCGIMVFTEPISIILVIAFVIWIVCKKNQGIVPVIIIPVLTILFFFILSLIKTQMMEEDFANIISSTLSSINPLSNQVTGDEYSVSELFSQLGRYIDNQNKHIVDNYYFLTSKSGNTYSSLQAIWLQLGNQLIFMFLIIMSVANIIYLLRSKIDRVTPYFSILIASFFVQIVNSKYETNNIYFCLILIALSSTTIQHMFLNHHPDVTDILLEFEKEGKIEPEAVPLEEITPEVTIERMERSSALAFFGVNDELYEQIKLEEKQQKQNNDVAATMIHSGFEDGKYISKVEQVEYFDEVDEPVEVAAPVPTVKAIPGTRPVEVVKPILADENETNPEAEEKIPAFRKPLPVIKKPQPAVDNIEPEEVSAVSESINNDTFDMADNSNTDSFDEPDTISNAENIASEAADDITNNVTEGFVIRKRDKSATANDINSGRASKNTVNIIAKKKPDSINSASENKADNEAADAENVENKKQKKSLFGLKKNSGIKSTQETVDKKAAANNKQADNKAGGFKPSERAEKGKPLDNPLPLPKPHVSKDFDFDFDIADGDDFDV